MQKVITVTVTSGAGRVGKSNDLDNHFIGEHEFYKVNEARKEVIIYAVVDQRQDYLNIIRGL